MHCSKLNGQEETHSAFMRQVHIEILQIDDIDSSGLSWINQYLRRLSTFHLIFFVDNPEIESRLANKHRIAWPLNPIPTSPRRLRLPAWCCDADAPQKATAACPPRHLCLLQSNDPPTTPHFRRHHTYRISKLYRRSFSRTSK